MGDCSYMLVEHATVEYGRRKVWAVFIPGIFLGGPQKTYNFPQISAKLCPLNLFFGRDIELQMYHGSFLMGSKHGKLFVIKQSKECNFMPQKHKNTFRGRALP